MGLLKYNGAAFIFEADDIGEVRLAQSFKFDRGEKPREWFTTSIAKAIKLRAYADDQAMETFKNASLRQCKVPESLSVPKGKKLRKFQKEGAKFILSFNRTYLADDPGLGKTIQFITAVNTKPGKTLVVCPPSLVYNWHYEISEWSTIPNPSILIVNADTTRTEIGHATFVIVPDSLIERPALVSKLIEFEWRWLGVDEAHRFKEEGSARTRALLGHVRNECAGNFKPIASYAKRVCFLSGTPWPNRPIEVFPIASFAASSEIDFMNFGQFACAYNGATIKDGGVIMGHPANEDKLHEKLYSRFMLKRFKADVLSELPSKTREIVFMEGATVATKLYSEAALSKKNLSELVDMSNEFRSPLGEISKLRRDIGTRKAPQAADYIREILINTKEKVIIFAWHTEVIKELENRLRAYKPLVIMGGMDGAKKDSLVRTFQSDKSRRLIIGNIEAMGVGHTLTAASRVIFVEPSWVPGVNEQAEDRAHRIGQKDNVFVQYLVLRGTIDEYVLRKVLQKQKSIDRMIGAKTKGENNNGK